MLAGLRQLPELLRQGSSSTRKVPVDRLGRPSRFLRVPRAREAWVEMLPGAPEREGLDRRYRLLRHLVSDPVEGEEALGY